MFETASTTIGQGGRVVIPAAFREKLGLKEGDEVRVICEKYGYRIVPISLAWQQAKEFFSSHKQEGDESLVDELIKTRREEFRREQQANS